MLQFNVDEGRDFLDQFRLCDGPSIKPPPTIRFAIATFDKATLLDSPVLCPELFGPMAFTTRPDLFSRFVEVCPLPLSLLCPKVSRNLDAAQAVAVIVAGG